MTYAAPLADMRFTLEAIAGLKGEAAEIADAILEEAARFAAAELAPLIRHAEGGSALRLGGGARDPLVAAYLAAVARAAEYVNQLG